MKLSLPQLKKDVFRKLLTFHFFVLLMSFWKSIFADTKAVFWLLNRLWKEYIYRDCFEPLPIFFYNAAKAMNCSQALFWQVLIPICSNEFMLHHNNARKRSNTNCVYRQTLEKNIFTQASFDGCDQHKSIMRPWFENKIHQLPFQTDIEIDILYSTMFLKY